MQRWGRLVGDTPALAGSTGPACCSRCPGPIDQVVRVKTKHVSRALDRDARRAPQRIRGAGDGTTLDPLAVGYALTGDQNVVHVADDRPLPGAGPGGLGVLRPRPRRTILRVEVTAAMVRSLGEMGVDHVLSDGRKDLIATATRRAQAGLDAAHSGLALVSLELTGLAPPRALASDFDAVQSAYIETETKKKEAPGLRRRTSSRGRTPRPTRALQTARADAAAAQARARGRRRARSSRSSASTAPTRSWCASGCTATRSRRRSARRADVRWVPPPVGARYQGLRFRSRPDRRDARRPAPPAPEEHP